MTLAECARLIGAEPKWVQNALATLHRPLRYDRRLARQLGLARILHVETGMPLALAMRLAAAALADPSRPWAWSDSSGVLSLRVDLPRYLTGLAATEAALRREGARGPGRPRMAPPRGGLAAARRYGLDVGALRAGLARPPADRLRALDADQRFVEALRARKEGREARAP